MTYSGEMTVKAGVVTYQNYIFLNFLVKCSAKEGDIINKDGLIV